MLDQMVDLLGAIRHYATELDLADMKMHPLLVEQVFHDIDRVAADLQQKIQHDLEPMLQRQSRNQAASDLTTLTAQVAALQEQVDALTERRGIIPLTRRRKS